MTPSIAVAALELGDENLPRLTDIAGLDYVDFEIEPHCSKIRQDLVRKYSEIINHSIYAIDDLTAIQVVNESVEVISDGTWRYIG